MGSALIYISVPQGPGRAMPQESLSYPSVTSTLTGTSPTRPDQVLYPEGNEREMSDSVPETGGDTGEVVDASAAALATEDQEAEEQLHDIMQQEDPDELKRQVDHWKKAAQRHERTARDNSGAAKRLREMEDANKSELQKAVDAQQAAERERDAVRGDRDRMLAAAAHDLDPDLIDFLGTGTEEDINARAEVLAGIITKAAQ